MTKDRLEPGERLASYRIVRAIGQGGMGQVYEAVDERSSERVALKVVLPAIARDERFLARFRREAKVHASVEHPHVLRVIERGEADGRLFLALQYVDGGSLHDRVKREGPLPWKDVAVLGAKVARALGAIHARGIVHRDVKPANVLLDARGEPFLSDFGLVARTVPSASLSAGTLTHEGELVGTLEFLAPEQSEGKGAADGRADLYALGATLHALLVGRPPFEGRGVELITKHLTAPVVPPSRHRGDLPAALDRLVVRLLEKDRERRPATGEEVALALEAITRGEAAGAARRGPLIATTLAVLVLGAAAALGAGARPGGAPPPPPSSPAAVPVANETDDPDGIPPFLGRRRPEGLRISSVLGRHDGNHAGGVTAFAVTRDGKLGAAADDTGRIQLWDVALPRLRQRLAFTAPGPIAALAFTPNGRWLVSARDDGRVTVWDVARGLDLRSVDLEAKKDDRAFVVCPRDDRALVALRSGVTDIDLAVGRAGARGQTGYPVRGMALDPTEARVITCNTYRLLRIATADVATDLGTGALYDPPERERATVDFTAVALRGERFAGGTRAGTVALGAFDEVALRQTPAHEGEVRAVAFLPDARRILSGGADGAVAFTETPGTGPARRLGIHRGGVTGVALLPDGRHALTAGADGCLRAWDLVERRAVPLEEKSHRGAVSALVALPSGELLSGGADGTVRRWDTGSRTGSVLHAADGPIGGLAAAGGQVVFTQARDVVRLDLAGAPRTTVLGKHDETARAVAIEADGSRAFSCGDDARVLEWDLRAKSPRKERLVAVEKTDKVAKLGALVLAPPRLLAGGDVANGAVAILDPGRADAAAGWLAIDDASWPRVHGLAAGGETLAAASDLKRKSPWAWALATLEPLDVESPPESPLAVAVAPDGARVAWVSAKGDVVLHRRRGRVVSLEASFTVTPEDQARSAAFGPDGSLYVGTARGVVLRLSVGR